MSEQKRGRGRPSFQPTPEQHKFVMACASCGMTREQIARAIGCDADTLYKHFRETLETADIKANAQVGATLFNMAVSGQHIAATIFWMKTRCKWRETENHRFVDAEDNDRDLAASKAELAAKLDAIIAGIQTVSNPD